MPSDKNKRAQRHQTQAKQNISSPTKRTKVVEKVAGSGYREVQYIGDKKYYVPLSDDPNRSITGTSNVETATVASGSSGISNHGELGGLTNDDHSQYTKHDGSRAFTGNQSFGGNNITTVGDLDVNGHTTLDRTSIDTTDGILAVTGTNNVEATPTANITLQAQGATDAPKNVSAIGGKSDFSKYGNILIEAYNKISESGSSASNHGANGVHILADAGNATTKHNNIFIEQKNTPEKANGYGVDIKSSNGVRIRSTNNSAPSPPTGQPTNIKMYTTGQMIIKGGDTSEPTSDSNTNRTWIQGTCELETLYKTSGATINCSTHDVTFDQLDTQKLMRSYTYIAKDTDISQGSGDSNKVDIVSNTILANEGVGTVYQVTVGIDVGDGVHLRQGCLSVLCSRLASTTWFVTILGSNTNNISGVGAVTASNANGMRWHNTNTGYNSNEIYITAQRIAEASHYP